MEKKNSILKKNRKNGTVVQWLEHRPVTAEVAGSSPVSPDESDYKQNRTARAYYLEK